MACLDSASHATSAARALPSEKSRLPVLLEHLSTIDDPCDVRRIMHPLAEILFLVVRGTIADYDDIAAWGEARLDFLRRHLPFANDVPGGRWLTILMNRIDPALFQAAFAGWVRETWPDCPEFVAIDGKTSRRSHDRATGGHRSIWSPPSPPHRASCSARRRWRVTYPLAKGIRGFYLTPEWNWRSGRPRCFRGAED